MAHEPAPGTPPGTLFSNLGLAALDAAGRVTFYAALDLSGGVTDDNRAGIWTEREGELSLVARAGSPAPGTPLGVSFAGQGFGRAVANRAGYGAFQARLNGWGVTDLNDDGIWSNASGALSLIAREGSPAPGAPPGWDFGGFYFHDPMMSDEGGVAFLAYLRNADRTWYRGSIWAERFGALELVALAGTHAPDTPDDARFRLFDELVFSSNGRTAFLGQLELEGGSVIPENDKGVWTERNGVLGLVVREGDYAPGAAAGAQFDSFHALSLNAAGETAFRARLRQESGEPLFHNEGIWADRDGVLALVALQGDHAPGIDGEARFYGFGIPVFNGSGRTAFRGGLSWSGLNVTATSDTGIWSEGSGSLALVAREGSHAPGTPVDAKFGDFTDSMNVPAFNSSGRVAFRMTLQIGGSVNASNDGGIWAEDPQGRLTLVAREGDLLEVAPGDVRTIDILEYHHFFIPSGGEDGRPVMYNDDHTLVFFAQFKDGSSGLITAKVLVPEPGSLTTVGIGIAALLNSWRRSRRARLVWGVCSAAMACASSVGEAYLPAGLW